MKRKIYWVVTVADKFVKHDLYPYDIPQGNEIMYTALEIKFEQTKKDPMPEAYDALRDWINVHHPNMDFRTYYWTLEIIYKGI